MTSTVDATEIPDLPTRHDLESLAASVRQVHAQIRLISAANFAGFIELSRSEQRDVLLALLTVSESTIDLLDQLPQTFNPDQG